MRPCFSCILPHLKYWTPGVTSLASSCPVLRSLAARRAGPAARPVPLAGTPGARSAPEERRWRPVAKLRASWRWCSSGSCFCKLTSQCSYCIPPSSLGQVKALMRTILTTSLHVSLHVRVSLVRSADVCWMHEGSSSCSAAR